MAFRDGFLVEFDLEMANTRKLLECIPADKFDWQPHARSKPIGGLGNHIAMLPATAMILINKMQGTRPSEAQSKAELLELFDASTARCRHAIVNASEEQLSRSLPVTPSRSRPLPEILRERIMNHLIHHRGQLVVYLRLLDVALPGMYGPSADEN